MHASGANDVLATKSLESGPRLTLRAGDGSASTFAASRGANAQAESLLQPVTLRESDYSQEIEHSIFLKAAKRLVDIVGSLLFFLFFGWLYLALAIGVWMTSGRPVLFSQKRYGYKGTQFEFYKFRSMVPNAEDVLQDYLKSNPVAAEQWNKYQKLDNDPRITKFGHFIRKTSLDELPQFWNVLKGDMSLVGPRPCLVFQKELYGKYWNSYTAVRPGITGLWQVSGRNTVSYRRRILLDVQYVRNLAVHRDIYIFIKTIWVVLSGHGSK